MSTVDLPPPPVDAHQLGWLVDQFVSDTAGVKTAVVVSVDGLLVCMESSIPRAVADQLAAVASGLFSMAKGAGDMFQAGPMQQLLLQYQGGFLILRQLGPGAVMACVIDRKANIGAVGTQMAALAKRVGPSLSPAVIDTLQANLPR